jgi:hypothetical protein
MNRPSAFPIVSLIALCLTVVVSSIGLFDQTAGISRDIVNQYGDKVTLYCRGLYKDDSLFRAPIFRATDAIMLMLVCPVGFYYWLKYRNSTKRHLHLPLVSVLGVVLYYASSIAFGVRYNYLHLAYIALFGSAFYAFMAGLRELHFSFTTMKDIQVPLRGVYLFLALTGVALIVAWLPDIVTALAQRRSLLMIEHYTTEITYVLDMGLIAPACFICLGLLRKRIGFGYVLLDVLLTLCLVVGVILPVQTAFQHAAGISSPLPVLVTKVASFSLLAMFAIYFKWKLSKAISHVFQR